nr:RNA-directed DNA polymerase, eukaryota [Tanacetum cinerariifolium]
MSEMTFEEAIDRLKTYEERIKYKGKQVDNLDRLLFTRYEEQSRRRGHGESNQSRGQENNFKKKAHNNSNKLTYDKNVSVIRNENGQSAKEVLVVVNAKVMNNSHDVYKEASCDNVDPNVVKNAAVGNSGGILCVWEATVFKKDCATISDNFVAIYGTWLPSNSKVLFVAIYARSRRGSCFNPTSARVFDQFISASGLVDVKMEGYTFTWSHPSGSKMSKLDRFHVSEGIFSIFPSIMAVCLDLHLSDHRPIILCEVQADFGLIPFRFYHSWISLEGFDAMVEQTWRSFSHNDANKIMLIPLLGVNVYASRLNYHYQYWNHLRLFLKDEDYNVGPQKVPDRSHFCEEGPNDDRVSDVDEVLETNFGDNSSIPIHHIDVLEKQQFEDPFNIYRLLRKQPGDESHEVSSSLSHPPGFTPDVSVIRNENGQSAKEILVVVNAKVMNDPHDVYKESSCDNVDPNVVKK